MDTIRTLIAEQYDLMNVGVKDKCPINIQGNKMNDWQTMPYDQLCANHNMDHRNWGIRVGQQTNGKHIMSLDFDICGKKDSDGNYQGCPITKQKFEDFASISSDYYNGGTQGNFNALIDYSNSPMLLDAVKRITKSKIKFADVEILLTKCNQVIPPSKTICKITKELGEKRRWNGGICVVDEGGPIEDFVFQLLQPELNKPTKSYSTKVPTASAVQTAIPIVEEITPVPDKYLDLLFNVITNTPQVQYGEWLKIGTILKTNHYDRQVFIEFSADGGQQSETKWEQIDTTKPISIHALQNMAKDGDYPERLPRYKEWLKKYDIYFIKMDDLLDTFKVAQILKPTLSSSLRFCKETWYMLNKDNLWKSEKEPLHYIISELRKFLDATQAKFASMIERTEEPRKSELIEIAKEYLGMYKSINASSYTTPLVKYLKTELRDDDFASKIDNNPYKLAFKDGIMDLKNQYFRRGIVPDDYISKTIPFNYEKYDTKRYAFLKQKLLEVMNNNAEHLEYFLTLIGYTFIGMPHLEKALYFCVDKTDNGKGDNGKSLLFDALTELMPCYCYKSKKTFLEEKNTKVHKQLAEMKGFRMVWLDEFSKNRTDDELMKEIANGTKTECEIMYGTSEPIDIKFKCWVLTNNLPDIKGEAVYNRYKQISFGSHFDRTGERKEANPDELEFIADVKLPDELKTTYRNEIFQLVIEYAHRYSQEGVPPIPEKFLTDAKETKLQNDAFGEWFEQNLCKGDGLMALKAIVWDCGLPEKEVKDGMKRRGFKYDSNLRGCGKYTTEAGIEKHHKGGFKGVIEKSEQTDGMH